MDNASDINADEGEVVVSEDPAAAEANKENQGSSSPNINLPADSTAAKRPGGIFFTAVSEKGRSRAAAGSGKGTANNSPSAMNSRGAMLLNLSR